MAYGDEYTGAGDAGTYTYAPKTAQQNEFVAGYPAEMAVYLDDIARAEAAGVTGVDKIDYAEALRNYESRSDVELFANRRAREYADTFEAQDFSRVAVQIAGPFQSSTVGTTSVVEGDDYTDEVNAQGTADTADDVPGQDNRDDEVIDPNA